MTLIRGKMGPFVGFLGIAALVLGGLGFVTREALRLESERRESQITREVERLHAEAVRDRDRLNKDQEERYQELLYQYERQRAGQIRLALWQLDGTVIPALAREDSRPYPHYISLYSPFPAVTETGVACEPGQVYLPSPLMTAPLPTWMLLHFQIDPINGWTSPQVIPDSLQRMLRRQPIELALHNIDDEHKRLLNELKSAYPARSFLVTLQKNGINVDNSLAQQGLFNSVNPLYPNNSIPTQNIGNTLGQNPGNRGDGPQQPGPNQPEQQPSYGRNGDNQSGQGGFGQSGRGGNFEPDPSKRMQVNSKAKYEGIYAYWNDGRNYASLEALFPSKKLEQKQAEIRLVETEIKSAKEDKTKKALETKLDCLKKEIDDLKRAIQQPVDVELGSMTALWLPSFENPKHLVLIRPAQVGNTATYQGILLDWAQLQENLKSNIADVFPDAKLIPVPPPTPSAPVDPTRMERSMTALPVDLDPGPASPPERPEPLADVVELPRPPAQSAGWTPLRIGLALAWVAALIALAAVGLGGWSLLDLSERRIRFVSAVTHELRTPLTTLRLYLDLLNSGLVSDEKQRDEYLKTLSGEADRLQRLIGNVLDFARLEKSHPAIEKKPVPLDELLGQLHATWNERCAASSKDLQVQNPLPAETVIQTDRNLVEQILGNLIDNARKYSQDAADPSICLRASREGSKFIIEVEDRGPGVTKRERCSIFRPFRRGHDADVKAGGVGLGLALATRWAGFIGGRLSVQSGANGIGACFRLELPA
jgi:signal transduction histidine kinase